MILVGYSGHAYVAYGIAQAAGIAVSGYCDSEEKTQNPFNLTWYGSEESDAAKAAIKKVGYFVAIGDNNIRKKVTKKLITGYPSSNIIHPTAVIAADAFIKNPGIMVSAGVIINPLAIIEAGAICNTGCIIEHECEIGKYAHIGPGASLCGNVKVGECSFIGAGAVIKQGIVIGANCMIGAGAVVVKNVADNCQVKGVAAQ